MKLSNPEAPATRKQLWLLHILTKEDTRAWKLTMKEASDKINELKGNGKRPLVNPHATAIQQDKQLRQQQSYDRQQVKTQSTPLFTTADAEQVLARHNKGGRRCPRCNSTNIEVYLKSGSNKFIRCKDCKWAWKERGIRWVLRR